MFYKIIIVFVIVFQPTTEINAQHIKGIYLGDDDVATKFDIASMNVAAGDSYPFFDFLGYETLWYEMQHDTTFENTQRAGVILTAKSTITHNINFRAAFGRNDDSCIIDYEVRTDKIRNGRSAATSILNLFSKREDKNPQSEPDTTISHIQSQGIIRHNEDSAAFFYSLSYKNKMIPNGWLVLHGDTLFCKPVAQEYKRKGKIKKANYYFLQVLR